MVRRTTFEFKKWLPPRPFGISNRRGSSTAHMHEEGRDGRTEGREGTLLLGPYPNFPRYTLPLVALRIHWGSNGKCSFSDSSASLIA